jgi:hypothetical protein
VTDRRRDAGVRRAQHRPAELERTHRRDLVVLLGGDRTAVPRIVGHVDEQMRIARAVDQLGAERILVQILSATRCPATTSGGCVAPPCAGRRAGSRAPTDEPADHRLQWNRLAERTR